MIMGGGGFAQHAKNVTKNNRALLRSKKRYRKTKEDVYGKTPVNKLHFKKSTEEEINNVKDRILLNRKNSRNLDLIAFVLTIIIIALLWLFFSY